MKPVSASAKLTAVVTLAVLALTPVAPRAQGKPTVVDLPSAATGATHRISIAIPGGSPPEGGFPVVYLLDASWYLTMTLEVVTLLTRSGDIPPAVIVGVGYDDPLEARRLRVRDFTTPAPIERQPPHFQTWKAEPGGSDRFRRFLRDELKPYVSKAAPLDASCQLVIGHSLGGLFATDVLFREPDLFTSYALGDPSLWWNNNEVLSYEARFVSGLPARTTPLRVFLAQSSVPTAAPAIRELGQRLGAITDGRLTVASRVYEGDTHNSMIPGFIAAALRHGLACAAR